MNYLYIRFQQFMKEEEGQTATEYALVIGVFVLTLAAVTPGLKDGMTAFFEHLQTTLSAWGTT